MQTCKNVRKLMRVKLAIIQFFSNHGRFAQMKSSSIQPVFFVKSAKKGVKKQAQARADLQVCWSFFIKLVVMKTKCYVRSKHTLPNGGYSSKSNLFAFFSDCVKVSIKNIFHLFLQNLLCIKLFSVLVLHFLLLEEKNLFRMQPILKIVALTE